MSNHIDPRTVGINPFVDINNEGYSGYSGMSNVDDYKRYMENNTNNYDENKDYVKLIYYLDKVNNSTVDNMVMKNVYKLLKYTIRCIILYYKRGRQFGVHNINSGRTIIRPSRLSGILLIVKTNIRCDRSDGTIFGDKEYDNAMAKRLDKIINLFRSDRGFRYKLDEAISDMANGNILDHTGEENKNIDIDIWRMLREINNKIVNSNDLIEASISSED